MNENLIIQKLEQHDKKFEEHDARFDAIDRRFDAVDERIDILARKLIEHDQRFDTLEHEIIGLRREMLTGQDQILTILRRLDHESAATINRIKRLEARFENDA